MNALLSTLFLSPLAPLPAVTPDSEPPKLEDRCALLGSDGYPKHCEPTGPDGPTWAQEVCCVGSTCVEPGVDGCPDVTSPYTCELAALDGYGGVTCLFEVPLYCEAFSCPSEPGYGASPQGNAMCCYQQGCWDPAGQQCSGDLYWCDDGVTNSDGTVTCFDPDTP